jgi:hypothetical protein
MAVGTLWRTKFLLMLLCGRAAYVGYQVPNTESGATTVAPCVKLLTLLFFILLVKISSSKSPAMGLNLAQDTDACYRCKQS